MKFLAPKTITDTMLTYSSIAEPAAGEELWVASTAYTVGQRVIRTQTHRVYECVKNVSGSVPPEDDSTTWQDYGPTKRWAAFDGEINTETVANGSVVMKIRPGFFTAIGFQALKGEVLVEVREEPGGELLRRNVIDTFAPAGGLFEYLYGDRKTRRNFVIDGYQAPPTAEITLTFSSAPDAPAGAGLIAIGTFKSLRGSVEWSRTANGAQVEPITYSSIKTDEFGVTKIRRRHKAKSMRAQIMMPRQDLDYVIATIHEYLDVPVLVVGTDAIGFTELQAFGLMSATGTYQSHRLGLLEITVKGLI